MINVVSDKKCAGAEGEEMVLLRQPSCISLAGNMIVHAYDSRTTVPCRLLVLKALADNYPENNCPL